MRPDPYPWHAGFVWILVLAALAIVAVVAARNPALQPAAPAMKPPRGLSPWYGRRGEAVRDLQVRLRAAGYDPGPIDGKWGDATELAFRAWERAQAPVSSKPQPTNGARKEAMLTELAALRTWAKGLSTFTQAMWAQDLLAMKARAESLHAQGWPEAETAALLRDARTLKVRIAT